MLGGGLMTHRLLFALGLALASASCGKATLPALGPVSTERVCPSDKRCDVKGDTAVNLLRARGGHAIKLAQGLGPESFLGKIAPKRKAGSALKTCGSEVKPGDWHASAEASREIRLQPEGQEAFRDTIRGHLAVVLGTSPELSQLGPGLGPLIAQAIRRMKIDRVGLLSQTYWLSDAAFEQRISLCGEEEAGQIVYSMTVLRLSKVFVRDLGAVLEHALDEALAQARGRSDANAGSTPTSPTDASIATKEDAPPVTSSASEGSPSAPVAEGDADAEAPSFAALALRVMDSLEQDLRLVVALGFDNP